MPTITISSGTTSVTSAVATTTGYLVEGSGTLDVSGGGIVSGLITIMNAGIVNVASGGEVLDTTVDFGGTLNIRSGGTAIGTVTNQGAEEVSAGGTISGTVVSFGGDNISSGGVAVSTTIVGNNGSETVFAGGKATGNSPNDTFVVSNSSDVVVPKAGSHDVVYSAVNYTLPTGVDALILEGSATHGVGNSDAAGDGLYAANPGQVATLSRAAPTRFTPPRTLRCRPTWTCCSSRAMLPTAPATATP